MVALLDIGEDAIAVVLRHCTLLSLYRIKVTSNYFLASVNHGVLERAGQKMGWDASRVQMIGRKPRYATSPLPEVGGVCTFKYPQQAQRLGNRLIVSDSCNDRVVVLTLRGEYVCHLSLNSHSTEEYSHARGLVVYDGMVYVADQFNHRIHIVTIAGDVCDIVRTLGPSFGSPTQGRFADPHQLAVSSDGIFVGDNNGVHFFSHGGVFVRSFAQEIGLIGMGPHHAGERRGCVELAASGGEVFCLGWHKTGAAGVSGKAFISVFSTAGVLLRRIGHNIPHKSSLAVHGRTLFVMAERDRNDDLEYCIVMLTIQGAILGVIDVERLCTPFARPEFLEAGSLSIDASGTQLYFCDQNHHCVYMLDSMPLQEVSLVRFDPVPEPV
jgi:hypothetical protein